MILILILIRACPLATLGVGARFQVRGHKPWGRKAAKRAYKLAFLPPRPHRLLPLRAFHLSASRSQPARAEILNFEFYTLFVIHITFFFFTFFIYHLSGSVRVN
jgi:hypothetical protein